MNNGPMIDLTKIFISLVCVCGLFFMGKGMEQKNNALESLGVFMEMLSVALAVAYAI